MEGMYTSGRTIVNSISTQTVRGHRNLLGRGDALNLLSGNLHLHHRAIDTLCLDGQLLSRGSIKENQSILETINISSDAAIPERMNTKAEATVEPADSLLLRLADFLNESLKLNRVHAAAIVDNAEGLVRLRK